MIFFLVTALALFILSMFADRKLHNDTLTRLFFGLSALILFLWIEFSILDSFYDDQMLEVSPIDALKLTALKFGGWSILFSVFYFIGAFVTGLMALLARFIESVEAEYLWLCCILGLINGIVFLVGFFIFFEALALILGVIVSIISIILGIKKLGSKNST